MSGKITQWSGFKKKFDHHLKFIRGHISSRELISHIVKEQVFMYYGHFEIQVLERPKDFRHQKSCKYLVALKESSNTFHTLIHRVPRKISAGACQC